MDIAELKPLVDQINERITELRAAEDERQTQITQLGEADTLTTEKVGKIEADLAKLFEKQGEAQKLLDATVKEIERQEARIESPVPGGGTKALDAEKKQFAQIMRHESLYQAAKAPVQQAVDADFANNSTSGGVAIPEVIAAEILAKILDISPFGDLVRRTTVGSPNYERLVDTRGLASGWAGEATTRSETGTPKIERVTFTHGELYAVPKASQWSINDIMFDVVGWLTRSVSEEFAYQEGVAIATGNGTNKPTGFLAGTPVSTTDEASPARAFGVVQYLPTGAAADFQGDRLASPAGRPDEVFVDAFYALKPRYRMNAVWAMNASVRAKVAKLKDADGNPLLRLSNLLGAPDTIFSRPVREMEAMPAVGANAFPVALADWNEAYELIDIQGMRLIRDEVTSKGNVLFYVARRVGGKITNDDAIKLIKCSTS